MRVTEDTSAKELLGYLQTHSLVVTSALSPEERAQKRKRITEPPRCKHCGQRVGAEWVVYVKHTSSSQLFAGAGKDVVAAMDAVIESYQEWQASRSPTDKAFDK